MKLAKKYVFRKWIIVVLVGITIFSVLIHREKDKSAPLQNNRIYLPNYVMEDEEENFSEERSLTLEEAIEDYWDEIREYVEGTTEIEACSFESGNCYLVEADISDGAIETVYFSNGGYLYFDAEIDSDGYASDFDINGNSWDFEVEMDSGIVKEAVYEWAEDKEYTIDSL